MADPVNTIAIVSAAIAATSAAAAVGGAFIQWRNTTRLIETQVNTGARQSRAAVVSANRQKWIDALRDDVAEFLTTVTTYRAVHFADGYTSGSREALLIEERAARRTMRLVRHRIELRLNPDEFEHNSFLAALDAHIASDDDRDTANMVVAQAKAIFKAEWRRLKLEASGIDPVVRTPR
jgi:hypothetical protein